VAHAIVLKTSGKAIPDFVDLIPYQTKPASEVIVPPSNRSLLGQMQSVQKVSGSEIRCVDTKYQINKPEVLAIFILTVLDPASRRAEKSARYSMYQHRLLPSAWPRSPLTRPGVRVTCGLGLRHPPGSIAGGCTGALSRSLEYFCWIASISIVNIRQR